MERAQTIDKVIGMDGSVLGEQLSGETYRERQRLWECDDDVLVDLEKLQSLRVLMKCASADGFLGDEGEGARGVLAKMQFGVHSRALGARRVSRHAKDKGRFSFVQDR